MTFEFDSLPEVILRKGKETAVKRRHPWIFSGAIARESPALQDGDMVRVSGAGGEFLAVGHYHNGSIKIRILSYEPVAVDGAFWEKKLADAWALREQLGLLNTDAFRLVHGEGDQLSGLVIDIYAGVAVLQAHSIGMHRCIGDIAGALRSLLGDRLAAAYDKSRETLPADYAAGISNGFLFGSAPLPRICTEYGRKFEVDFEKGQKTGFFLDQRENRQLLAHYAPGKRVLNTFSYSGGFSVFALSAGASEVLSVDISEKAMALCERNVELNEGRSRHKGLVEDVMKWLKSPGGQYDIVVLDPPAFAKSLQARHRALQGYKRLNAEGLKRVTPGGLLFTFSCSQVVDKMLFYNTVVAAAMEAGREVQVLHHLTQGPDHPVNIFHPEGHYLKGLVLRVR